MCDSSSIGSDSDFLDSFLRGAARAFFVSAYVDFCEESEHDEETAEIAADLAKPGPREDWCDYAPPAPPYAYALAGVLVARYQAAVVGGCGIYTLAMRARRAEAGLGRSLDLLSFSEDDYALPEIDAEEFGNCLAMQAMGHGVSWDDNHKGFHRPTVHVECSHCNFSVGAYRGGS